MTAKTNGLNIYYTWQVGYGLLGGVFSMLAYTSLFLLTIHSILPELPLNVIAVAIPLTAFMVFYVVGYFFLRKGGYAAQASFGGRANPQRLNWEMEKSRATITIKECEILIKLAQGSGIDTSVLTTELANMKDIQKSMDALLKMESFDKKDDIAK